MHACRCSGTQQWIYKRLGHLERDYDYYGRWDELPTWHADWSAASDYPNLPDYQDFISEMSSANFTGAGSAFPSRSCDTNELGVDPNTGWVYGTDARYARSHALTYAAHMPPWMDLL